MYNLAEITVYNLRHNGSSYFLSLFDQKDTRQHTDPASHIPAEKKYIKSVKDIS